MMKILIVEDDLKLAQHLKAAMRQQNYEPTVIHDEEQLKIVLQASDKDIRPYDLMIVDRLLGDFDAKVIIADLRKKNNHVPIIVLSAISTPNERADLINLGVDDYLGKPFSTQELFARMNALLRRSSAHKSQQHVQIEDLLVDTLKRTMSLNGQIEELSTKEFLLLKALTDQFGKVWSKSDLLDYVWEQSSQNDTNVVEVTIKNLRKKINALNSKLMIRNSRNVGYWVEK